MTPRPRAIGYLINITSFTRGRIKLRQTIIYKSAKTQVRQDIKRLLR